MTKVAVIIVNWRVRELLRECLSSIARAGGLDGVEHEIVVVDNDSADGSVEMLREDFPNVRLIVNADNVGFGAANNQAADLTGAPYLILLNPDTCVRNCALRHLVDRLEGERDVAIIGCRLLNADGSLQRWTGGAFPTLANVACHYLFLDRLLPLALRPRPLYLEGDVGDAIDVDWVSGACMIVRREALNGALFDRRFFMYAEDMELCQRVKRGGWRVKYDPEISITHYQGASIRQQSASIMLSSLKGPRFFFLLNHGRYRTAVFDILTLCGFGCRFLVYRAVSLLGGGRVYRERARSSREYLRLAWRVWREPVQRTGTGR